MRRGRTPDEKNDLTSLFRKEEKRTLSEIDTLIYRQEGLKEMLGNKLAREIEADPDLFYNHERFNIWQKKARFRAICTTIVAVPAIATYLNGMKDGIGLMRNNRIISVIGIAAIFFTSYAVWHRIAGYNKQAHLEQQYSQNVKVLRNLIIKQ